MSFDEECAYQNSDLPERYYKKIEALHDDIIACFEKVAFEENTKSFSAHEVKQKLFRADYPNNVDIISSMIRARELDTFSLICSHNTIIHTMARVIAAYFSKRFVSVHHYRGEGYELPRLDILLSQKKSGYCIVFSAPGISQKTIPLSRLSNIRFGYVIGLGIVFLLVIITFVIAAYVQPPVFKHTHEYCLIGNNYCTPKMHMKQCDELFTMKDHTNLEAVKEMYPQLKKSYRALAREIHPDRAAQDDVTQKQASQNFIKLRECKEMFDTMVEQPLEVPSPAWFIFLSKVYHSYASHI